MWSLFQVDKILWVGGENNNPNVLAKVVFSNYEVYVGCDNVE